MKKKKSTDAPWAPSYKIGQRVKTPEGERMVCGRWGRSYELDKSVTTDKPRTWFDESQLDKWEEEL